MKSSPKRIIRKTAHRCILASILKDKPTEDAELKLLTRYKDTPWWPTVQAEMWRQMQLAEKTMGWFRTPEGVGREANRIAMAKEYSSSELSKMWVACRAHKLHLLSLVDTEEARALLARASK